MLLSWFSATPSKSDIPRMTPSLNAVSPSAARALIFSWSTSALAVKPVWTMAVSAKLDDGNRVLGSLLVDEGVGRHLGRIDRCPQHRAGSVDHQHHADGHARFAERRHFQGGDGLTVDRDRELSRVRGLGEIAELDHHLGLAAFGVPRPVDVDDLDLRSGGLRDGSRAQPKDEGRN